ncbi:MAG TPA: CAP domain-containing protein [Anaerolineales bacterium]|nr:CAP domain-containing protein [Anaerolineales bacterium]
MKKVAVFLAIGLIVFLSACGTPAATPTTAPTVAPTTAPTTVPPTAAAPTTASESPTTSPAPTTAPTAAASAGPCTDQASFVADVTVPDYSHFDARSAFTKTWRVKNSGTCTWSTDYKAVYSHGAALGGPASIPLVETAPGAMVDISADMVAPATDGKYQTFYQLQNASGDPIPVDDGASVWALITVGNYLAVPPTAAPVPVSSGGAGLPTINCVTNGNADFLSQLAALVNASRASNNLPALTVNDKLSAAAQAHSEDMACNNFLRHDGWNGSTPDSRVAATGFSATGVRENIYAQPPQYGGNAQAAVDWWMGDPIHRDAILDPAMKEIGVGYAAYTRSDLGGYFTVDFAAP